MELARTAVLGLVAGGTILLGLPVGSILYVVMQLLFVAANSGRRRVVAVGLLTGFLTDAIVAAAGIYPRRP